MEHDSRRLRILLSAAFIRLQATIGRACALERSGGACADWPAQAAAAIRAGLEWAAEDPDAANVLTNQALALGSEGIGRYHRLLDDFAYRLSGGRGLRPENLQLPAITERALAGGLVSLVAQRLDSGRAVELPDLATDAIQFVLTPYLGVTEAMRVVRTI